MTFEEEFKQLFGHIDLTKLGIEVLYSDIAKINEFQGYTRKYHLDKYKECLSRGVRLIIIFSDEWEHKKYQILNFLKSALGVYERKIYARLCECKEVPKKEAEAFLFAEHMQGPRRGSLYHVGLYYEGELLSVCTYGRHHRLGHPEVILDRLCFKDGVQVIGGASRMFKKGVAWCKAQGYPKLLSWSDVRFSHGNLYKVLGFHKDDQMGPDYSYVLLADPTLPRQGKQANKKKIIKAREGQTELERTKELGKSRIYDLGKVRWSYEL